MIVCFFSILFGAADPKPPALPSAIESSTMPGFVQIPRSIEQKVGRFMRNNRTRMDATVLRRAGFLSTHSTHTEGAEETYYFTANSSQKIADLAQQMFRSESWASNIEYFMGWGCSGLATLSVLCLALQQQSQYSDPKAIFYWGLPSIFFAILGSIGSQLISNYFNTRKTDSKKEIDEILRACQSLFSECRSSLSPSQFSENLYLINLLKELILSRPELYNFGHKNRLFQLISGQQNDEAHQASYSLSITKSQENTLRAKYDNQFIDYTGHLRKVTGLSVFTTAATLISQIAAFVFSFKTATDSHPLEPRNCSLESTPSSPAFSDNFGTISIFNFVSTGFSILSFFVFYLHTMCRSKIQQADKNAENLVKIGDYINIASAPLSSSPLVEPLEPADGDGEESNLPSARYRRARRQSTTSFMTAPFSSESPHQYRVPVFL